MTKCHRKSSYYHEQFLKEYLKNIQDVISDKLVNFQKEIKERLFLFKFFSQFQFQPGEILYTKNQTKKSTLSPINSFKNVAHN